MTLREWRERHLLLFLVAVCEGYFGPLWEPDRVHPLVELDDAAVQLLDIDARLGDLVQGEKRFVTGYFLGESVFLFIFMFALEALGLGAPAVMLLGPIWLGILGLWIWGRPLEVRGYWDDSRLCTYRSVLTEIYDLWIGVYQPLGPELRTWMHDAGAYRVLAVVDKASSLQTSSRISRAV